jgi:DNA-binding HxlR family transcriptional regulator
MNQRSGGLSETEPEHQVLKKTLEIISGKWRLFIILQLGQHTRRYADLRRMIPGISEKMLVQELKALVLLGVLTKTAHPEIPPRVEYSLSERGLLILPTLVQLKDVGVSFLEPQSDPSADAR